MGNYSKLIKIVMVFLLLLILVSCQKDYSKLLLNISNNDNKKILFSYNKDKIKESNTVNTTLKPNKFEFIDNNSIVFTIDGIDYGFDKSMTIENIINDETPSPLASRTIIEIDNKKYLIQGPQYIHNGFEDICIITFIQKGIMISIMIYSNIKDVINIELINNITKNIKFKIVNNTAKVTS